MFTKIRKRERERERMVQTPTQHEKLEGIDYSEVLYADDVPIFEI